MTWSRMIGIGRCLIASCSPRSPMWHIMNIRTRIWASVWHVIQCPHERGGQCLDPLWSCFWLGWFWRRRVDTSVADHGRPRPPGCCGRNRGDITLGDRKEKLASQIELGSKPCTAKKNAKNCTTKCTCFSPGKSTETIRQKSSTVLENSAKGLPLHQGPNETFLIVFKHCEKPEASCIHALSEFQMHLEPPKFHYLYA